MENGWGRFNPSLHFVLPLAEPFPVAIRRQLGLLRPRGRFVYRQGWIGRREEGPHVVGGAGCQIGEGADPSGLQDAIDFGADSLDAGQVVGMAVLVLVHGNLLRLFIGQHGSQRQWSRFLAGLPCDRFRLVGTVT